MFFKSKTQNRSQRALGEFAQGVKSPQAQISKSGLKSTSALGAIAHRFRRDESGNIALMFGLSSLLFFTFAGLAIDYSRFHMVRSDLSDALDAANLAMARYEVLVPDASTTEIEDYAQIVFDRNFQFFDLVDDLEVEFTNNVTTTSAAVEGTLDAIILTDFKLGGAHFQFNSFSMVTETEVTKSGAGRVELALVLDVTGSMNGVASGSNQPKIDDLKDSVSVLLDTFFDEDDTEENINISVVPFNSYVNVGGGTDIFDDDWVDNDAEALYHGARFIHTEIPTNIDDSSGARNTNSFGSGQFGPQNSLGIAEIFKPATNVNHQHLYNSMDDVEWLGCVEGRPYPLDEIDTPPGQGTSTGDLNNALSVPSFPSGNNSDAQQLTENAFNSAPTPKFSLGEIGDAANSLFVPSFVPDDVDCEGNTNCFNTGFNVGIFETYTLGGFNRGAVSLVDWFSRPSETSHSENNYVNRNFVDDEDFAEMEFNSNRYMHYNEYLLGFRHSFSSNSNGSAYWDNVEQVFRDLEITNRDTMEHLARMAYVGIFDPANETYSGRYDDAVGYSVDENPNDDSTHGPNQYCPEELLPLTNSRSEIEDKVDSLVAHGFTNTAIGTMWGWRTLSPGAPFTEGVSYDDGQWQKAIVIMTDGTNSIASTDTHRGSIATVYGFAEEERMGEGINDVGDMQDEMDAKMLRICQRMKDEGILVYTIMFGLNNDGVEDLFQACSTEPDAPYFHNASDGDDLSEAFSEVASDLVQLHVSK